MFRVIIAGGRDFDDYTYLKTSMDHLLQNINDEIVVICGEAPGADTLGKKYAHERGYRVRSYPANWNLYGKKAGPARNRLMARNADALVAFWDGESRGTANMIEEAKNRKLKIRIKKYAKKEGIRVHYCDF